MNPGLIPQSDPGRPQANTPSSLPGLSADLMGNQRMVKRNFTISRSQFTPVESYMASNSGSVRQ